MKGVAVIFVMVLTVVALTAKPGESVSCADVQRSLMPCVPYLTGGGNPSGQCCGGVKGLIGSAHSRQDRQTVCNCIKTAASGFKIKPDAAAGLPGKCGVSIGYNISPNIDCSRIS